LYRYARERPTGREKGVLAVAHTVHIVQYLFVPPPPPLGDVYIQNDFLLVFVDSFSGSTVMIKYVIWTQIGQEYKQSLTIVQINELLMR
jgi:hypothetical protein